jgi:hypothetical protein
MEYAGKLYGKVGAGYFTLKENTGDIDKLKSKIESQAKIIKIYEKWLYSIAYGMGDSQDKARKCLAELQQRLVAEEVFKNSFLTIK